LTTACINRIATAVPPHDVHGLFQDFIGSLLQGEREKLLLFRRMARRAGIEHRFSFLSPDELPFDAEYEGQPFYRRGRFPTTRQRMQRFEHDAPRLAQQAVERLIPAGERDSISHLLVTSCTGFSAPGIDLALTERCGLPSSVARCIIGFMGCYAAINALKMARDIVRSEPGARVLIVNLELCTLHLQETDDLEQALTFLLFADGCAACLVSAEPRGIALDSFRALVVPDSAELMTWTVQDSGFDMFLSGHIPAVLQGALQAHATEILQPRTRDEIDLWAVHPGGRTVLDAVERALELPASALRVSRDILRRYGNMSSATVMFVLQQMMQSGGGKLGCAMAFGPGLTAETMLFHLL
jgi:predicted naringenin-chalcone synthase